ncbi:MAG: PQQ-dependent sugar dehydrogenase, partial [Planctomycetota bacterium]
EQSRDVPRKTLNRVVRFTADAARQTLDPASEKLILEVPQPFVNHNGGHLAFGDDGYLYVGLGDGGALGDPQNNAQDVTNLLGSILRLDIDTPDDGPPYAIPPDNPFADPDTFPRARPEIYAYGLRNPWRFSFDHRRRGGNGRLWAADVGHERHEEVNLIVKGGNYGWRIREGLAPFRGDETPNPPTKLIPPVVDHHRRDAGSITGGYVYHGRRNPLLEGAYVYGDYLTGKLFLLRLDSGRVREHLHFASVPQPVSFGLDRRGELYVCSFDGRLYTLRPPKR